MCEIEEIMVEELGELDSDGVEVLESMKNFERISGKISLLL